MLQVIWETAAKLNAAESADEILTALARAIASAGLYKRAVLTLNNSQGDTTAIGYHGLPDEVVATARRARRMSAKKRQAVMDMANKISTAYFIPAESGIDLTGEGRYIECDDDLSAEGDWQAEDQLFVPIHDSRGEVVGYASVDTPFNGQRPDLTAIKYLELLMDQAERALARLRVGNGIDSVESRWQRLMTDTEDVVFRVDLIEDSIEYVNPAVEKLTGYTAEEIQSRPLNKLQELTVHPDDREIASPSGVGEKRSVRYGNLQQTSAEYRLRHRDGTYRRVWEKRTTIYDDDGQAVAVESIMRDITDREELREKLTESELKYRHLAENTRDLIYTRDTDGNLTYLSPSAKNFLGIEPEQALQTRFSEWLVDNPINQASFEVSNAAVVQGRTVPPFTLELRSSSGRTFQMEFNESPIRDDHDKIIGVQGVGRNTAEHKKTEEALEKSERKFRELADLLPQTVFEVDLNGNLSYANRFGLAAFGYDREDLDRGMATEQLFIPEDGARLSQNRQRILAAGSSPGYEYTGLRKDGTTFPVMVHSSPIIQDGKPVGFRGVLLDLTEHKQAEQAMREGEARYRSLFENSPITMLEEDWSRIKSHISNLKNNGVTDLREHFRRHPEELTYCWSLIKVIDVNKVTIERFGAASKEELLAAMDKTTTDESLAVFGETIIDLENGQTAFAHEDSARRFDGRIIQSDVRLSVVPGNEDNWSKIIVSVNDITERKLAEEQLRGERDFVHSLMDTANSLIFCLDGQSRITVFNKELERVTGYGRDEVIGKSWPEIFLPKDHYHHRIEDFAGWVRQHPRDILEGPLITKSGEIRTILWSNSALFSDDSDEITALCVGQDVTDRREMEKALLDSEQRYHELFNSVMEGIGIVDENEIFQYANPAFAAILGEDSPKNLIGKNLLDYVPGDQKAIVLTETEKRRRGEDSQYELDVISADDEVKTLLASVSHRYDEAGKYIGAFGAVLDITKRKQIEETLREAREQLNATLNALPDLLFEVDRDGRFHSYRSTRIDLLYASPEEFLGKVMEEVLPAEAASIIKNAIQEAAETGRHTGAVYPLEMPTGVYWFELSIVARGDPKTPEGRFLALARDVTERVKAEEALRRSEEQFRTFAENIPGVVCIYDEYPDGHRESIYVGPGLDQLLGARLAKKVGDDVNLFMGLVVPEDRERLQQAAERAVASAGILDFEYRVRIGPDDYRWVRAILRAIPREDGRVRWEGQGFDVTDRREALEALRSSEETSRALLDATNDAVLLLKPDGKVLAVNATAAGELGVEVDRLIGTRVYDVMPPPLVEIRKAQVNRVIQTGQAVRYEDQQAGKVFDTVIQPLFNDAGEVERLAVFARDVTEREEILQQLRDKRTELDQANTALENVVAELRFKHQRARELSEQYQTKNAELEALVTMLSHDLKAPLISIRELTGLFRRKYARLIDEGGAGYGAPDFRQRVADVAAGRVAVGLFANPGRDRLSGRGRTRLPGR
ncbi:PAS domain S-box protein [Candidatus Zixiibacteriota bacterium]